MDLNRLVSYSLRIGVLISVALSTVGLADWAARGSADLGSASRASISKTLLSAFDGNPAGIIYLAVAILIATPVFRVALTTLYFVHSRDEKYTLITLAVLGMLLFALFSGFTS